MSRAQAMTVGQNERDTLLARRLRHEAGDFLQKVYASVALLQALLPPDRSREREILESLHRRAGQFRDLIDAIQDYLCPRALSRQTMDVGVLADRAIEESRNQIPTIQWERAGQEHLVLCIDPDVISKALRALLRNAADNAQSMVELRIEESPANSQVWLRVRDDGPGAASEAISFLAQPFYTTRPGHGGLGLTLALRAAEQHGGGLQVLNSGPKVFEIGLWLPLPVPSDTMASEPL